MAQQRYDAVVVGSDPNGLAAAITPAQRGRPVLVLEAQDRLGGAATTQELTLPGFHHDVFSAVHPAAVASPVLARWPLEPHGLRWVQPELAIANPLPGGRAAVLGRDLGRSAASLGALADGAGSAIGGVYLILLGHAVGWPSPEGGAGRLTGCTHAASCAT